MEADQPSRTATTSPKEKKHLTNELVYYNEELFRVNGEQLYQTIHRSIVALTFLDPNKNTNSGSGVLISKDTILTTAQNVFNKEFNAENTDFKIYIGADGVAEEYHQVEGWRYPQEFKTCSLSAKLPHNYAIMKLKKPVCFQQYLPLFLTCKECFFKYNQQLRLEVFGFPCAYPPDALGSESSFEDNFKLLDQSGMRMELYQYGLSHEGRITVIDAEQCKIGYEISTLPGQSGCPVVMHDRIIAVHVGGDKGKFNVGRTVDASFMNSLWKWREELNAAPFSMLDQNVCQHVRPILEKLRYKLNLGYEQLKSLDLLEYGNLLELDVSNNQLQQIDLAHCPRLTKINLSDNRLQRINITNNRHLTYLNLSNNKLQEADVTANVNLTELWMSSNMIAEINLTKNTKLERLWFMENRLAHVRLWISENVEEYMYTNLYNIQNQQSAVCRVELYCEGQGPAVREKAIKIVGNWMHRYSDNRYFDSNRYKCAYIYTFLTI